MFFDNLFVTQTSDALMEETHYYPFGLTMAGISSKAAGALVNKMKYNASSELQNEEFCDRNGLEIYETPFRGYDPQVGRFWQIDPLAEITEEQSGYAYCSNNPILRNDPTGLKDTAINQSNPKILPNVTVTAKAKPKVQSQNSLGLLDEMIKNGQARINSLYTTPGGVPAHTLEEWAKHYESKTWNQIVSESKKQKYLGGLLVFNGGPNKDWRYVVLRDGRILDMRHVLVVGMKTIAGLNVGKQLGAVGEIGQYVFAPASANQSQDYFSNAVGSGFLKYLEEKTINYSGSSTREFGNSQETGLSRLFLNFINEKY
jgi:RHS repeat-associated protein